MPFNQKREVNKLLILRRLQYRNHHPISGRTQQLKRTGTQRSRLPNTPTNPALADVKQTLRQDTAGRCQEILFQYIEAANFMMKPAFYAPGKQDPTCILDQRTAPLLPTL